MSVSFLYPSFLWCLLLVSIPILLHLFNFRKFKTVYFSNVSLLREIKEESKKARRLKNWLILLFRVLFISFLVLAFSFPYSGRKMDDKNQVKSIYIDNSFSMDNEGVEGNKLNNAKAYADKIVQGLPPNAKIHLVTNDFKGKHQLTFTKREAQEEISKINPSLYSRSFKSIMNRQSVFLQDNKTNNNQLYWISDFQQLNTEKIENLDSFQINLALLKSSEELNISLDSVWFESPVRKKIGTETLKFSISNHGAKPLKNQTVKLSINNRINSFTIDKLAPGKSRYDFKFQIPQDSLIKGVISIEDQALLFDNELLFSYLIPSQQKVCLIAQEQAEIIPTVKKVFRGDSSVELSCMTPVEIDYKKLGEQDLLLLGELDKISQNLAIELLKLSNLGKIIGIMPGKNTDTRNYNDIFKLWGDISIGEIDTATVNIGDIQKSHSFFKDVFEKKKERKNLKESLPFLYAHYDLVPSQNSETIIFKENNAPFLVTYKNFYYFGSGLSESQSNFSQKALIVPVLYQMLFKSINTTPIQYFISGKTKLITPSSSDRLVNIKSKNKISQLRVNNHTSIIPSDFDKGYYEIMNSKKIIGSFGLNYDRTESVAIDEQLKKLSRIKNSPLISIVEVSGNQSNNLTQLSSLKNTHWFSCLIMALVCLFVEMILIRVKI